MLTDLHLDPSILESSSTVLQLASDRLYGSVLLLLFGGLAIYGGWQQYEAKRLVDDTPTERVRSMAAGRTELTGRAWPVDEPFDEPFGHGEAVLCTYKIEEYESDGDDSEWVTKESGTLAGPFLLDDGTGRALVDADRSVELEISDGNRTRITVGRTEEEPPAVKEFLRTRSKLSVPDAGLSGIVFGEKRRYTQRVIPPGETVYVFGGATPNDGVGTVVEEDVETTQDLVIEADEASERFLVSDKSEERLSRDFGRGALLILALGVGMLAGGFFLLVTELGIAT